MYVNKEKTYSALGWLTIGVLLFFVSAAAVLKMIDLRVDYPAHIEIVCKITWEALIHPMAFLEENCYPSRPELNELSESKRSGLH